MEVTKRHHALPIALIILVLFAFSALALNRNLGHALVTRPFNVQPTTNGLAKFMPNQSSTLQTGPDWTQAGNETTLDLSLR